MTCGVRSQDSLCMDDTSLNNGKSYKVFEVLTFQIAWQQLGIWPKDILEIIEEKEYVPIPFSPPFLKGVVNSHGRIITVVDFPKLLELPLSTPMKRIVVLNNEDFMIGLTVPFELEISFHEGEKEEIGPSKSRFFRRMGFFSKERDSEMDILDPSLLYRSLRRYFKDLDVREALP